MTLAAVTLAGFLLLAPAAGAGAEDAYQSGQEAVSAGQMNLAEQHFRHALELNPEYTSAWIRLATIVAWRDRHEESIRIFEQALQIDPNSYDARLGLAKVTSWAGHYHRSTAIYEELLRERPDDRTLSMGLASVSSWNKQFSKAIEIYQSVLDSDPGHREARLGLARVASWARQYNRSIREYQVLVAADPLDRDASLGLARTLGWAGRLVEAENEYRDHLIRHPEDVDGRNGLAAVLSWSRRLDDSLEIYQGTLEISPGDPTALAGRARILWWQGRRPEAWSALDAALGSLPADESLQELEGTFFEGVAPVATASTSVVHDSDRNSIEVMRAAFSYAPSHATTAGIGFSRFDASQPLLPGPQISARLNSLWVFGNLRRSENWTYRATAGIESLTKDEGDPSSHVMASAGVSYRHNDQWTLGGSLAHQTFAATALSLDRGIRFTSTSVTANYIPRPRLATRFSVQYAAFSDGNRRELLTGSVRWSMPLQRPKISISWSERLFNFDNGNPQATRNGYFSPDFYWGHVASIEASDSVTGKLSWRVEGNLGLQRVDPANAIPATTDTVRGYHVAISYQILKSVSIEAYHARTNLALSAGGGLSSNASSGIYRSTESGFRLRWRIDGLQMGAHSTRQRDRDSAASLEGEEGR